MGHHHHHEHEHKHKPLNKYLQIGIYSIGLIIIIFLLQLGFNREFLVKTLNIVKTSADGPAQTYYLATNISDEPRIVEEALENDIYLPEGVGITAKINNFEEEDIETDVLISKGDIAFFDKNGEFLLKKGDEIILVQSAYAGDGNYFVADAFRISKVFLVIIVFLIIAVAFAKYQGITSFLGLAVSILILAVYIVPTILNGGDPIITSLIGSLIIAFLSLYLAHGINKKTTLALVSTVGSVFVSILFAGFFINFLGLTGFGEEEVLYVQSLALGEVNLRGLLLGGIIVGTLGVLDDITISQTSIVHELKIANNKYGFKELYKHASSVGKDHIASLINTLVMAYAGSAFPLFIIIVTSQDVPLWVTLNGEFIIEEIVRTIVGSITLILAVPVSTILAAFWYSRKNKYFSDIILLKEI